MRKIAVLIVAGVLLISGRATAESYPRSTLYDQQLSYPKTNPDNVKILRNSPDQKFIKIGAIELEAKDYNYGSASESDRRDNSQTFDKKLREEAARIGGDAVIILKDRFAGARGSNRGIATSFESPNGITYNRRHAGGFKLYGRKVSGVVIKFNQTA